MAKKQTSSRVSAIAGKYVGKDADGFDKDVHAAVVEACKDCGIPLSDRAALALTNRIETLLLPLFDDVKTLAASALSQDETPPAKLEGFSEPTSDGGEPKAE